MGKMVYSNPITRKWQLDGLVQGLYWLDGSGDGLSMIYLASRGYPFDAYRTVRRVVPNGQNRDYRQISVVGSATYIHDSRTKVGFDTVYEQVRRKLVNEAGSDPELSTKHLRLTGWSTYRISIPTTLAISLSYNASNVERVDDRSQWEDLDSYSVRASLIHYIM